MALRLDRFPLFGCRLCLRVALSVFVSILLVETVILIPSYKRYERDLLLRLEDAGRAAIAGGLRTKAQATKRDLLVAARLMIGATPLRGIAFYDHGGGLIGLVGEPPTLTPAYVKTGGASKQRSMSGESYDVLWRPDDVDLPVFVVGRLDARWIEPELIAFLWRIGGLVLLISSFVSSVAMFILGRQILRPMLDIRKKLVAARADPAHADQYLMADRPGDELGDMVDAFNALLRRLAQARRDDLRQSEERFKDFAASASDWYWEMDEHLRFSHFSNRFTDVTGVPQSALLGKTRQETGIPDVDRSAWRQHLDDLAAHRPFRNFVHPRTRPDGRVVWVSINGRPVFDDQGDFKGYRGTGADVTLQRRIEQATLAAKEQAEAANRAKSEFLANMSHELRTPLNAIIGFSEVIMTKAFGPDSPRYDDYIQDIHQSGQHLLSLINDILDLSKIEAGKVELLEESIDVGAAIVACLSLIAERANAGGIRIRRELGDGPIRLWGDERKFKQVVINLLSNAVKFTPREGTVSVRVALRPDGDLGIAFSDTGIGMAEENIAKALAPFGQIDSRLAKKFQGTGLGLPLAKSLVELHGGRLAIDSAPGRGTCVTIAFPADRVNRAAA